jgi:hypothetical protein
MLFMNDWQLDVMFPLNPRSKGIGRSLVLVEDATAMLAVVEAEAVADVDVFRVVVADELERDEAVELELLSARRLRSSAASGTAF